jgi:dihydrodipicolinate reductase
VAIGGRAEGFLGADHGPAAGAVLDHHRLAEFARQMFLREAHHGVHGAAGRMGRRVVAMACEDPGVQLIGGIDHAASPFLGQDIAALAGLSGCGVSLTSVWPDMAGRSGDSGNRCVIDFSLPQAVDVCVAACVQRELPLVVAT